jgi:hypothetical protein
MKRRILSLALLLPLLCPMVVLAADPSADPDGLTAPAPELAAWLDSAVRVFLAWLGI